jgi:translation elongation factor EF-4
MIGGQLIKSWSKSQTTVALSSAESELYACIKASCEGLGMLSMMKDYGFTMKGEIRSDASAALGIIARNGLGKMRHLDTTYLWIQEVSAEKKLLFDKVDGKENIADMMTKHVPKELSEDLSERMAVEFRSGRHEKAPELKD